MTKKTGTVAQAKRSIFSSATAACLFSILFNSLWGSAISFIKLGYRAFEIDLSNVWSIVLFAGCRFTLAGFFVLAFLWISQKQFPFPRKNQWGMVCKLGLTETVVQYLAFYIGSAHTSGVNGSMILSMTTFCAVIASCLIWRLEKMTWNKLAGCIIGTCGVIFLYWGGNVARPRLMGEGLMLVSSMTYALASILIVRYSKRMDINVLTGWQFVLGGGTLIVCGALLCGQFPTVNWQGVAILLYLASISAVTFCIWGTLLRYHPVSRVAVFSFCNPIVGVLLSSVLLGESELLGPQMLVSLLLVVIGIYLTNKSFPQKQDHVGQD